MDNETRLDLQYDIIQFLANAYYHLNVDDEECNDLARSDSYKIMAII